MIFPIIAIIALTFNLYGRLGIVLYREAILATITLLSLFIVISNELMSAFHLISPATVQCLWLLVVFCLILLGIYTWRTRGNTFSDLRPFLDLTPFEWICTFIVLSILAITGFIAFVSPPNNWDSMTYHLPRIMHWAAQGSLEHFPTDIPRQNLFPPGAEYMLLHIFLLTSNDQWFNLLQWSALVGSCLGVSLIARQLGASRAGQLLAAVLAATVPMAILQASSTQTDLIESFWLVVSVVFALRCREKWSWFSMIISAVAFAIAALTKGTFFIAVPVLVWAFAGYRLSVKMKLAAAALLISLLLCVNGGFWLRENILSGKTTTAFIPEKPKPSSILFNGLRHASVHWILPWEQDLIGRSEILLTAHKLLNEDASTLAGIKTNPTGVMPAVMALDEDYAGNIVHFFLIPLCLFILIFFRKNKDLRNYAFYVVLGGSLFVFINWQEWITRMHLPVFILFAPVVGSCVEANKLSRAVIVGLLIISASFFIVSNQTRPLVGQSRLMQAPRSYYYFMKKPLIKSYAKVSEIILLSKCTEVGLIEGGDSWEYPLWALTGYGYVNFHHVNQSDNQASKPSCLIVTIDSPQKDELIVNKFSYTKQWAGFPLQVFSPSK